MIYQTNFIKRFIEQISEHDLSNKFQKEMYQTNSTKRFELTYAQSPRTWCRHRKRKISLDVSE